MRMITVTEAAAARIKQSAKDGNMEGLSLRIAVVRKPDDSFHYAMGFDDASYQDDLTCKSAGINIVVSGEALMLVKDMAIDFVEMEKGEFNFIFLNPNDPAYVPPEQESPPV